MASLIKMMLVLMLTFSCTFLIIKLTGIMSIDEIKAWLQIAKNYDSFSLGILVILLLFADLFIAMPTLTIIILSGYFLGHFYGAVFSFIGVMFAGISGYGISYFYGRKFERFIIKDINERKKLREVFQYYGVSMILFSRAMPILPETTACMAGITKMPIIKFLLSWGSSSLLYVFIATYAGSISTIDSPKPAIIAAILITTFLWSGWYFLKKYKVH